MKIIGLRIDGIRKLSAINMEFTDKGLIQIRGKNRQGKTSIIDSLEILLRGNKYIETDMIQHGKDRAEIIGYIDEYEIRRIITEKSNRLEIKNKEGFEIKEKPQAFLDKLINALTFDPRPFLNKTPSEKLKFMMDLMKVDFTDLNKKIDKQETERLLVGREIKSIGEIKPVEKAEKIDIAELIEQKDELIKGNIKLREVFQEKREQAIQEVYEFNELQKKRSDDIDDVDLKLRNLKLKREELIKQLEQVDIEINDGNSTLEILPEPKQARDIADIDIPLPEIQTAATELIDKEIKEAETNNDKADEYEKHLEKKKEKDAKEKEYEGLNTKIKTLRNLKQSKLKGVKTPVEGLEIREEGIFYNSTFSENWGESEALRISSELCIGMDPELRAIFIDKGEAYDINSLKDLQEWAIKNDIQCLITIVDSDLGTSGDNVFYIEEGKII